MIHQSTAVPVLVPPTSTISCECSSNGGILAGSRIYQFVRSRGWCFRVYTAVLRAVLRVWYCCCCVKILTLKTCCAVGRFCAHHHLFIYLFIIRQLVTSKVRNDLNRKPMPTGQSRPTTISSQCTRASAYCCITEVLVVNSRAIYALRILLSTLVHMDAEPFPTYRYVVI